VVPRSQSAVVGGPLAVNKQGIIRGNLHDRLTDSVVELVGSVEKETQNVKENTTRAVEQSRMTALRHGPENIAPDRTRTWQR